LENILGIIMFIAFIIFRGMSDRKKGMTRGPKAKTADTMPRAKTKPIAQSEPPRKMHPAEAKTAPPVQKQAKPVRKNNTPTPPPFVVTPLWAEGEGEYESLPVMEGSIGATDKVVSELGTVAVSVVANGAVLTYNDLRRAVLWSEILAKPRAMRRSIR